MNDDQYAEYAPTAGARSTNVMGHRSGVFVHTVRSCCRPVDTTRSHGVCPDCHHLRSGHNADGECGVCVSAQPYGGWKEKA